MDEKTKRKMLSALAKRIKAEDLDLAIRVLMDFPFEATCEKNKKGAAKSAP